MTNNFQIKLSTTPPVHQWIVRESYLLASSKLTNESQQEFDKYLSNIVDGSKHEDYERLEGDIVVPFYGPMPFLSHYWNPDNPNYKFLGKAESCISRAFRRWEMAHNNYNQGDLANAYDQLGHVAHLLSDMSTPAHVNWDLHAVYDTYEMGYLIEFDHQVKSGYNYNQWNCNGLTIATEKTLIELFTNLARIAQQFDSNDIGGKSPDHSLGHSGRWEYQLFDSNLYAYYDVSYADAYEHAKVCMPAAISYVAALYLLWESTHLRA